MDERLIYDKSDMRAILERFPSMIREAYDLDNDIIMDKDIKNICITGMGGSAFSGDLLKTYLKDIDIPIFINKTYALPGYIKKGSLVFANSYSGNTEETVSAYRQAIKKGIQPVVISSGGKLEQLSSMNKNPYIKIPRGYPPRLATPFLFYPMLRVLQNSEIIEKQDSEVEKTISSLRKTSFVTRAQNVIKRLVNKVPVIYCSDDIFCVAEKWKTDINENSKTPAFYNIFPEFNHNEINAYINLISDHADPEPIKKRIKIIKKIIMKRGIDVMEIAITGDNYMTRLVSAIYLGLWVSYYLALEYKTDPTPVEIIEELKKELAE